MADEGAGESRRGHDAAGGCGLLMIFSLAAMITLCVVALIVLVLLNR